MKIQDVYYALGDQIQRALRTQQKVVTVSLADAQFLRQLISPPKLNSSNQHAVADDHSRRFPYDKPLTPEQLDIVVPPLEAGFISANPNYLESL